jgi:membrane protease YdiL (CAAX protease family)
MLALGLLLLVPILMWSSQSLLLYRAGRPIQYRIHSRDLPKRDQQLNRLLTNAIFAAILLAYPLLRGDHPWHYYAAFFPLPDAVPHVLFGAAGAILFLTLLYLAWLLSDQVRFERRHPWPKLLKRLAGVPLTALLVAFVEELLFRAMLLNALLEAWPVPAALATGVVVFASAHYVRSVKRYWTLPGHLALGLLFCTAFIATGNLWLPIGLHAGGVLILMGVRPLIRYHGPPWLVGQSIFPYAGVVGIVALLLLTWCVHIRFGGPPL